ncbi:MAG: NUDIX hydrolase, partial [Bradyrhizobium sp.]|nr:NUDIX hydrolase [Bradyrhizobium sp.]
ALPEGTTLGTLSRLREVLDGVKVIPTWRPEQPAQAGSL